MDPKWCLVGGGAEWGVIPSGGSYWGYGLEEGGT